MNASSATRFRYIYGPVPSWRLGSSLGIDLLSHEEKICSYDCIYCQLGRTKTATVTRQLLVAEDQVLRELERFPGNTDIDFITFSGRGEPTLALNLGKALLALRTVREEAIAVITNASLMDREDVREELSHADLVIVKLDACSEESFAKVNRPFEGARFDVILEGIKKFRKHFRRKLALQVMLMKENAALAAAIAGIAKEILPDEVQINTPLRPCGIKPLEEKELSEIKKCFGGLSAISVYESRKKFVKPVSDADTLKRRGKEVS